MVILSEVKTSWDLEIMFALLENVRNAVLGPRM